MTPAAEPVAGIVLAAGSSRRMGGRDKLYLEIAGESLLRRSVRQAIGGGLDPVLVVVGPAPERARHEVEDLDCRIVVNDEHAAGMGVSLARGVGELPAASIAVVALLADMPLVKSSMIEEVVRRHREGSATLVVSRYGEEIAPPILYERGLFSELRDVTGDVGGKPVIRRHLDSALAVEWPPHLAQDVDDDDDLARVLDLASG